VRRKRRGREREREREFLFFDHKLSFPPPVFSPPLPLLLPFPPPPPNAKMTQAKKRPARSFVKTHPPFTKMIKDAIVEVAKVREREN